MTNNVRSGEFSAGRAVMTRKTVSMSRPTWNQITRFGTMKLHWSSGQSSSLCPARPCSSSLNAVPRRFNAHPLRTVRSQTVILYYLESEDRDQPRNLKRCYVKATDINRYCNVDIRNSTFHNKKYNTNLSKAVHESVVCFQKKTSFSTNISTTTISLTIELRFQ